jgi:hypothetical protein
MPDLELRYCIPLEDYSISNSFRPNGPLFHRWLPDGENDLLRLNTSDQTILLTAWFKRRGYVRDSFIEFAWDKFEVDPTIMERQAILDAGPIIGCIYVSEIPENQFQKIIQNKVGDPDYIAFGKRIIRAIIPPLMRLIRVLKINYGQYWLKDLYDWDSRSESLGAYCSHLQLKWRQNPESEFNPFRPTENQVNIIVPKLSKEFWMEYMQKEDFKKLTEILNSDYAPRLSETTLFRAHKNRAEGNLSNAFIDAHTALELAITDRIKSGKSKSKKFLSALNEFWNLPIRTQLISFLATHDLFDETEIELVLAAIDIRNKIVHEGYLPIQDTETMNRLDAIINTTSKIINPPEWKNPYMYSGNKLFSP